MPRHRLDFFTDCFIEVKLVPNNQALYQPHHPDFTTRYTQEGMKLSRSRNPKSQDIYNYMCAAGRIDSLVLLKTGPSQFTLGMLATHPEGAPMALIGYSVAENFFW